MEPSSLLDLYALTVAGYKNPSIALLLPPSHHALYTFTTHPHNKKESQAEVMDFLNKAKAALSENKTGGTAAPANTDPNAAPAAGTSGTAAPQGEDYGDKG